jgi:hypothetical protein
MMCRGVGALDCPPVGTDMRKCHSSGIPVDQVVQRRLSLSQSTRPSLGGEMLLARIATLSYIVEWISIKPSIRRGT